MSVRASVLLLLLPLACSRREQPPTAIGGGPVMLLAPADDARTEIARARCSVALACGDVLEMDPCVTREEARLNLECEAVHRARLDRCVERTRARACNESTALAECAGENLCPKEERR